MDNYTFSSKTFDQALADGKLIGIECEDCGQKVAPQRQFCPKCGGDNTKIIEFSGKGKLAAFTVIYVPSSQMADLGFSPKNPYCSGVVALEEGPGICAQVLGFDLQNPSSIKIGTPLEMEMIAVGKGEESQTYLGFRKA